jgi:hypothetical protein
MKIFNFKDRFVELCTYYWDKEEKKIVVLTIVKEAEIPKEVLAEFEKLQLANKE